jgi:EthD domain
MPYNILIFVTRRSSISHSDFKKHYETIHIPLLQFYGGEHFPKSHRRHYLQFSENDQPTVVQGDKAAFDFDTIAEVSFDDEAAFQAFLAVLTVEEASKTLRMDEDKFSDREKMKIVVVGDVQETKT